MCRNFKFEKMKNWCSNMGLPSLEKCILAMACIDVAYAILSTLLFTTLSFTSDFIEDGFTDLFFVNFEEMSKSKKSGNLVLLKGIFLATAFVWMVIQLLLAHMLHKGIRKHHEKSVLCVWWFWYWLFVTILLSIGILYDLSADGDLTLYSIITMPVVFYRVIELVTVRCYLNIFKASKTVSGLTLRRTTQIMVVHA